MHALQIMQPPTELGALDPLNHKQNLIKFILHLYHKVQFTVSILSDKTFQGNHFYQPSIFEIQTGSESNPKFALNRSFVHSLTHFHTQINTFF